MYEPRDHGELQRDTNEGSSPRVPVWVLLSEAAFLTGKSEESIWDLILTGQIRTKRLERRGAPDRVLLRSSDLQPGGPRSVLIARAFPFIPVGGGRRTGSFSLVR